MRPWLGTMHAVDEAERRGDAQAALQLIHGRLVGPDGGPFWRPARINRLTQVVMLGSALPRWAVTRWVLAQARDGLGPPGDPVRRHCLARAIEVRGGTHGLSHHGEADAIAKIVDHDWVYRQLYLYELGGLARFVRTGVTPDLVAGADHLHDWMRAPMFALRLVDRAPDTVTWERLDTGERARPRQHRQRSPRRARRARARTAGADRVRPDARGGATRRTAASRRAGRLRSRRRGSTR